MNKIQPETDLDPIRKVKLFPSFRLFIAAIFSLGFGILPNGTFTILNFSLVCMLNYTSHGLENAESYCPVNDSQNLTDGSYHGTLNWNKAILSNVLSSINWGSVLALFFAVFIVSKLGVKRVLQVSTVIGILITLATPETAKFSGLLLIALRFVLGMAISFYWPCITPTVVAWSHPSERGTIFGIVTSGFYIGSMCATPVTGWFCATIGWEYSFYLTAASLVGWLVVLSIFFTNDPISNRWISQQERDYLLQGRKEKVKKKTAPVPWMAMATCPAVLATFLCFATHRATMHFINQYLPRYFKTSIGLDVKSNGYFMGFLYFLSVAGRISSGYLADALTCISKCTRSKLLTSLGFVVPAIMMVAQTQLQCGDRVLMMVLFTVMLLALTALVGGYLKSMMDLTPTFCGVLTVYSTQSGYLFSAIYPYIVEYIIGNGSRKEWSRAFYFVAGMMVITTIAYIICGRGKPRKWDPVFADASNKDEVNPDFSKEATKKS